MKASPNFRHNLVKALNYTFLHKYLLARNMYKTKKKFGFDKIQDFQKIVSDSLNYQIRITYKTSEAPETFADIMGCLMLARFYGCIGKKVEFIWQHSEIHFKSIILNETQQNRFSYLDSQKKLIFRVLEEFSNIKIYEVCPSHKPEIDINMLVSSTGIPIYRIAEYILDESIKTYIEMNKELPDNFFLDHNVHNRKNFIAINFRHSAIDSRRNTKLKDFVKDLQTLNDYFPNHNVRIFSHKEGLDFIYKNLFCQPNYKKIKFKKIFIEPQNSSDYSEAFSEILYCSFFFMRRGGGMSIPVYYSNIPYLVIDNDFGGIVSRKGSKNFIFSHTNQIIMKLIPRYKLKRILRKIAQDISQ